MESVLVRYHGSTHLLTFPLCSSSSTLDKLQEDVTVQEIKRRIGELEGVPWKALTLTLDGKAVCNDKIIIPKDCPIGLEASSSSVCTDIADLTTMFESLHPPSYHPLILDATLTNGLMGGKGGFGTLLRTLAKQKGAKPTTDFGACRDLSGRRLRHVNDDIILQKWKEAHDKGQEFDVEEETPSGIEMWYLGRPGWSDKVKSMYKKRFQKPRRKTQMCIDWLNAREREKIKGSKDAVVSEAGKNRPPWWGCPRGRRCEFAHGEQELRGPAAQALVSVIDHVSLLLPPFSISPLPLFIF